MPFITRVDSTRIFVNDSTAGFAVSSLGATEAKSFMDITTENYFIGHESGSKVVPSGSNGKYNSFLGYQAGKNTMIGRKNVALGYRAGLGNDASFNIFIGNETGMVNKGDYNLFMGHNSGISNSFGSSNIFIGYNTGKNNINGSSNTLIGYSAGENLGSGASGGNNNTFIGKLVGYDNVTGQNNVIIGNVAMRENEGGSNNVMIGYQAGRNNGHPAFDPNAGGNIFIGYQAGYNEYLSNKLYIENSSSATPLIWGDFTEGQKTVIINGDFTSTGKKGTLSDGRYKKDLQPLKDVVDNINAIEGIFFSWKEEEYPDMVFGRGRQIGVIAQELEKVYPELVNETAIGYKTVDYEKLSVILLEGVKQQQKEMDRMQDELDLIKEQLQILLQLNQSSKQ